MNGETARVMNEMGRLHAILENVSVILFALDRNGIITYSAGRGLGALGFRPGEIDGQSAFELYRDVPWVVAALRRALAGESFAVSGEIGDVWLDVTVVPTEGPDGTRDGAMGVANVVTDLKRRERDLAESVSLLRATLESTADGILVVDPKGHITSFNQRFVEMWRIPGSVIATRDDDRALAWVLDQLVAPDEFLAKVRDLYARVDDESFDVLRFKDGRVFERFSLPQRIDGRAVGRVWSFRDVTLRRQAEAERDALFAKEEAALAVADEAVRAREEFVSVAAHELRTPLTSLQLALQMLQRARTKPGPGAAGFDSAFNNAVDIAVRQGRRIGRLVDSLLDISRLDTGQFRLEYSSVDLSALVREIVLQSKPEVDHAGSALWLSLAEDATGTWDRARVEQVVTNLLSNAIKYGAGRPIEIRLVATPREVELRVVDQGIGISPDVCDRVFERFARAVSPEHYGGLGLGLYIVRRIVEAHGGTISVKSKLGAGAEFIVTLPRDANKAVQHLRT